MVNSKSIWLLDTPTLLLDLDSVDKNLAQMNATRGNKRVRIHFKSLKCAGLAKYLVQKGFPHFLCAKLNEAEVLAEHGVTDILIANQIVGDSKIERLANLAQRSNVVVCVDCPKQVEDFARLGKKHGVVFQLMVEIDIGMTRCGVLPGTPALDLARLINSQANTKFAGIQAYDGHLQLAPLDESKEGKIRDGIRQVAETVKILRQAGIEPENISGSGTGTYTYAVADPVYKEIQPGSFLLMDSAYVKVRPEFQPSLTLLTTVISTTKGRYILDAGSKAISKDFNLPVVKDHPEENLVKISEEHARVEIQNEGPIVGDKRLLITGHCCATMNLHRSVVAHRGGIVESVWPIEASGRYD